MHLYHTISAPFAEYPLTRRFDNPKIPKIVIALSILLLLILTLFNVYTQGRLAQTETILSPHWYPKNNTINCQQATINVGNTYFTNEALANHRGPPNHINDGNADTTGADYRGEFAWTIGNGVDTHTSFRYQEGNLSCNVTSIRLYFNTFWEGFLYRICTRCSTPRVESESELNYLSLCVSYDSVRQAGPIFTEKVQVALKPKIRLFYSLFKELHFPPGTLPGTAFPPDYTFKDSKVLQTAIPNHDIVAWFSRMNNFNYTPARKHSNSHPSYTLSKPEAQGKLYLSVDDTDPIGFSEGVIRLMSQGLFDFNFAALGVGNVPPFPVNVTLDGVSRLRNPLPKYFNLTQSIMALMMDVALNDVHNRTLGASYLCTVTKRPWKAFFPMLAMIIGNCSGVFAASLAVMISIARNCENRTGANRDYQQELQVFDFYDGNLETTSLESK